MLRLFELLKSKGHVALFVLLEIVAIILLYRGSNYHSSIILSSTNAVTGRISEAATLANTYIGLKEANVALMNRNAQLEREVLRLKNTIERLSIDSLMYRRVMGDTIDQPFPYDYRVGKVVGKVLYGNSSYLTIDIGEKDGVYPDMAVVGTDGIVGVIKTVGHQYSQVLPAINKDFAISCKIKDGKYIGILKWDGETPHQSLLTNLPKHVSYTSGDSVYTSSYSAIFPEGIYVGTVQEEGTSIDDNFCALRVNLSMNLDNIKYVYVLTNYDKAERQHLDDTLKRK